MKRPYIDIADRIKWHRSLMGLTQMEYSAKAGLNRAQLNNWESGSHRIGLDGALALRRTYGLSLDFIYLGTNDALDELAETLDCTPRDLFEPMLGGQTNRLIANFNKLSDQNRNTVLVLVSALLEEQEKAKST